MRRGAAIWYHGGPVIRDWHDLVWDRDRSMEDLNAEGPGMYWTNHRADAEQYVPPGGVVYCGRMTADFRELPRRAPDLRTLVQLYAHAPAESQEIFLTNWGFEWSPTPSSSGVLTAAGGQAFREIKQALGTYLTMPDLHTAIVALYHDLYRYQSAPFVSAMITLGYDGVVARKRVVRHLILWNVDALEKEICGRG